MSWQSYVDDYLMCLLASGNRLTAAAIIGLEGNVWARSEAFPLLKPEEISAIVNAFSDSSNTLAQNGLYLGGTKYMVIQGEQGVVIRGKKGQGGVTIKKTTLALVIGIYDDPVPPSECNMIVEGLGDYLKELNY